MLELLAQGAGSKLIAKELGYQDGTMRVYLHNLYRKLGVANKTEAVIWYLKNGTPRIGAAPAPVVPAFHDDPVGQMAITDGLYITLGVMGQFLGPWSRVWEVGARLAGDDCDIPPEGMRARMLWNALLKGDFAGGKADYEVDEGSAFIGSQESKHTSGAVYLAAVLVAGGYSHAARQFVSRLKDKRRSGPTLPAREAALLDTALEAFEGKDGLPRLQKITEGTGPAPLRHLAMALMFHAALSRRDAVLARQTASVLWKEAEAARKELQAMGDSALSVARASQPVPQRREKAAAR
jgi:hypothetical protein